MNRLHKLRLHLLIASFLTIAAFAQSGKVERTGPAPSAVPSAVHTVLEDKGYRVTLNDGWTAELWLARDLKLTPKDVPGALYPELSNGEFVGVLSLPKGMSDFRGQAVPAGTYTLRYHLIPQDANHMGVSPDPDFLLAIPVDSDPKPEVSYPLEKLVALSSKTTGAHPAVLAMEKAGEPGTTVFDDQKFLVLTVTTNAGAKPEKLGIVLKGQAAQ
jgi:hypothetical protein